MGKGEIARYEQFLLFPQCFQKAPFPGASKGVIVWEWLNRVLDRKSDYRITVSVMEYSEKEIKIEHIKVSFIISDSKWLYI